MANHRFYLWARAISFLFFLVFSISFIFASPKLPLSLELGVKAFYLGNIQNGDFAGTTYFESENELFLVPSIKAYYGLGGVVGGRLDFSSSFPQGFGFEVGYCSSNHKYAFMDAESASTTASISNIFLVLRSYFLKKRIFQPFIYFGLGRLGMVVKNGSYSYAPQIDVGDATYWGIDLGLGIGGALYLPANFVLRAEAGYHYLIMEDVEGVQNTKYHIEATKASYPRFSIGLSYSFKLGKT